MSHDTDKYAAYAETVLELHGVPNGRLDLRCPLGASERAALAAVGLDRPFAVLTAENPAGENDEDAPTRAEEQAREAGNDRALASLVDTLGADAIPFVRVDGTAPDGSYRERCVAVVQSRDAAVDLARRFDQLALFWFDGDAFWLLPAEAGDTPRRLPWDRGDGAQSRGAGATSAGG
jgi:hypothetical protein